MNCVMRNPGKSAIGIRNGKPSVICSGNGIPARWVILHSSLQRGGAEHQSWLLAKGLRNFGCAVAFVGLLEGGALAEKLKSDGFAVHTADVSPKPGRFLSNLTRTLRLLRRLSPDVLLAYTALPNLYCGLLWPWTGARAGIWNQRDVGLDRPHAWLERWAVKRVSACLANSWASAAFLENKLGVELPQSRLIPNGIEYPPKPQKTHRSAWNLPGDRMLVCMLGKVGANKDHTTLLHAWKEVTARLPGQALLVLAGRVEGPGEACLDQVRAYHLQDDVVFLGEIDDVAGLVSVCDLGVFSSVHEGLPNGVLECMAGGLALAATDIAGIRECLPPEQYPYLAPPGNSKRLADILCDLLRSREARQRLGALNARHIQQHFSVNGMVMATLNAVMEVLP